MSKVKVNFTFADTINEFETGTLLSNACSEAGFAQDLVCGGNGKCGKCAVEIKCDGKRETVLSCKYPLEKDIEVIRIFNRADRVVNVLTTNNNLNCAINPMLSFLHVTGNDIMPDHCGSFEMKIKEKYKLEVSYHTLKKLARTASVDAGDKDFNFVVFNDEIIDVNYDDDDALYGLAIDIGSTTVAAYLYDMTEAKLIGTYSSLNAQTALGADVISRIGYATKEPEGVEIMQKKVCDTINKLLAEARERDGINTDRIYHTCLCGNSTMQHLFLGLYPRSLGNAPFVSTTHDSVQIKASEVPLDLNPEGIITFLPLLGGFVGADTTAVLIGLEDDGNVRLAIDLGTNGEIAVGTKERYVIASTACGPALEGAGLSCGMRAADGAVQHFKINDDGSCVLDVIGNCEPTGICGSGIIDILAELIRHNVINSRGQMMTREKYVEKNGEDLLCERLIKLDDGINAFEVAKGVTFSQLDAREIQKAKAAIMAGCLMIIEKYSREYKDGQFKPTDIHEVCLAGAFGNYLAVDQAQLIGLFPDIPGVPVRSIGNGAGTGVQMYLLDKGSVRKCRVVQQNADHTELNFEEDFMETYFDEMTFKNANF